MESIEDRAVSSSSRATARTWSAPAAPRPPSRARQPCERRSRRPAAQELGRARPHRRLPPEPVIARRGPPRDLFCFLVEHETYRAASQHPRPPRQDAPRGHGQDRRHQGARGGAPRRGIASWSGSRSPPPAETPGPTAPRATRPPWSPTCGAACAAARAAALEPQRLVVDEPDLAERGRQREQEPVRSAARAPRRGSRGRRRSRSRGSRAAPRPRPRASPRASRPRRVVPGRRRRPAPRAARDGGRPPPRGPPAPAARSATHGEPVGLAHRGAADDRPRAAPGRAPSAAR